MKDVTVVLAHGAWADGSSWARVVTALKAEGTTVSAAPLPLTSLADDVAAVNRSLNRTEQPIVLVGHAYAIQRYRPLHCGEDQAIVGGSVLRKRHLEGLFGQPNQTIRVRCKLWRMGMGFEAVEHVGDLLTLVRRKSSHINQRLHSIGARKRYDRTGIGVSHQHNWPFGPVQAPINSSHVVGKRG